MATEEVKTITAQSPPPAPKPNESSTDDKASAKSIALANVEKEKNLSFIKAWEESELSKVQSKAQKKLSDVDSWENKRKAEIDHDLKIFEEDLEKKKADYADKMRNKMASIHKQAEEKRAIAKAAREEEILKTQELAAKHIEMGTLPKKPTIGCLNLH